MIKFCVNDDGQIAVGTGNRPIRWCRSCYVKECGPQFLQFRVTIPDDPAHEAAAIACARTGEDIERGGTVWLDPVETRIEALIYAGYVEPIPAAPVKAAKTGA